MDRVCEILGIQKPVIQGPMAWISTAPLVAAVSNAGGLRYRKGIRLLIFSLHKISSFWLHNCLFSFFLI